MTESIDKAGERPAATPWRSWRILADPRVLAGLAITAVTLWLSFRDLDFAALGRDLARADLWVLVPLSFAANWATIILRGLRWRHLVAGVVEVERGPVIRAMAVGFTGNNLLPLRAGELLRAWILAREAGASSAAVIGTVILERAIDAIVMFGMAALLLGTQGARLVGVEAQAVLIPLGIVAGLPLALVLGLGRAPDFTLRVFDMTAGRVLSDRLHQRASELLRSLADGLTGLAGRHAAGWVIVHSLLIWGVVVLLPFWAALASLDITTGTFAGDLVVAYTMLLFVAAAVGLPSAPGFFGPYHAACWVALAPFGVAKELAVACGTLAHATYWISTTLPGLWALRYSGTGMREALEHAEPADEIVTGEAVARAESPPEPGSGPRDAL